MTTQELLARARQARGAMALADTQTKDRALLAMAEAGGVELPTHRAVFTLVRRLAPG